MEKGYLHIDELKKIIGLIRKIKSDNTSDFNQKLRVLIEEQRTNIGFIQELNNLVDFLFHQGDFLEAFSESGIQSNLGLSAEIYKRIKHKILPPLKQTNDFNRILIELFDSENDIKWIKYIDEISWEMIYSLVSFPNESLIGSEFVKQLENAIVLLGHRFTTIGIDPYLVKKFPELDDNNSPFFELNQQILLLEESSNKTIEFEKIEKLLNESEHIFFTLQQKKDEFGTSLHFSYLLKRAQQHINRLRLLIGIYVYGISKPNLSLQLITVLLEAEYQKNQIWSLFSDNTSLLASRIISHTSEKGEHYIGFSKEENKKLFKSAIFGGLVVVFLVYIKHFIHQVHASLFFEGILFGLNYGLGFVLMHLMHFTLATKQPTMTASYIAASIIDTNVAKEKPLKVFWKIIKSQLISLFGNLIIVLPLCFITAYVANVVFDKPVFNFTESYQQFYSNHPFMSASLIYACVTGVFLSLSGIVIGYVDNKVVYSNIKERIIHHPKWSKQINKNKLQQRARFIEKNAGAIIGNLFLGFCLGMAGNLGEFIGLPFDIRHITISAGNFGIAFGSNLYFPLHIVATVLLGVIAIGLINILSSFIITFTLACRSNNLSLTQSLKLLLGITK